MQRIHPKSRLSPVNSCGSLLLFLVLAATVDSRAIAAEALTQLPVNIQDDIKTVCLPVQYQQGALAYRECINNELNAYGNTKAGSPVTHLSFDDKYAVQQACSNAGEKTSATYQNCVRQQVADLNALPVPNIDGLSDDEQYALQQTCFEAQSRLGAGPYRHCINRALAELRQLPAANFTGMSQVAQNGIQLRCSANHQNVVNYRKCLIEAVGGVTAPPTTTAARTIAQQQRTIERTPATKAANVIGEPISASATAINASSKTIAPAEDTLSTVPVANTNVTSSNRPTNPNTTVTDVELAAAQPEQNTQLRSDNQAVALTINANGGSITNTHANPLDSDADGSNSDVTASESAADSEVLPVDNAPPISFLDRLVNVWMQLKSAFMALDGINQIIVLCALGLPLLLLLAWSALRKRTRYKDYEADFPPQQYNRDLLDRVHPDFDTDEHDLLKERLDAEAEEFFGTIDAEDIYDDGVDASKQDYRIAASDHQNDDLKDTDEVTEPFAGFGQEAATREHDDALDRPQTNPSSAATRIATKPEIAAAAAIQSELSDSADDARLSKAADRGTFAKWLATVNPDDQLTYAIEFLIYWIAYGDERYDPALKEVLFQLQEPDDRDLIKRWVLKHDVIAFRDTISWLQNNSDSIQRRQIIDLLMVLLVNEAALTPVQNTILRFLGDAFGIGNADLDSQYREAFGTAMAPLPRADKPKWWQRQPDTASLRWDARAVAEESLDVQYRVRLGLALSGPIDEEAVVKGFRRAARRCHPDRFDTLTERERELAEMQFEKFEDARDFLLGVNEMND